jgi:hypothetical protein
MKKHLCQIVLVSFIGFVFLLTSCRTLDLKILSPVGSNTNLLPALETEIDVRVIEDHLSYNLTKTTSFGTEEDSEAVMLQTLSQNQPLSTTSNDFILLFERDVRNIITNPFGETKGKIVCNVAALNTDAGSYFFGLASAVTLGVLNLFGFPATNCSSSIDIEVELYNQQNELLAYYQAIGKARILSGLYYGYLTPSDLRAANIKAFKKAMNKIKKQIEADSNELLNALSKE